MEEPAFLMTTVTLLFERPIVGGPRDGGGGPASLAFLGSGLEGLYRR